MSNSTELPAEAVALFKRFLQDPVQTPEEMCRQLDDYVQFVSQVKERNVNVDLATARRASEVLKQLLTNAPQGKYKYAQAAARYLIEDLDANDDLVSESGFDDDVMVVNSVANHFGRPDLVI